MTVEFPHVSDLAGAAGDDPAPSRGARVRSVAPWVVPAVLAAVAMFLPVTTTVVSGDVDAVGTVRVASRIDLHAFGRYTEAGRSGTGAGGPEYGWVWLVLLVGFVVAAVWAVRRPHAVWPGLIGTVAGAVGVGGVATLLLTVDADGARRAADATLGAGAWTALAAGVAGLAVGVVAVRQSARANAGG